jgi:3D (Asp-Asp-Asp) domain-containing protein
MNNISVADTGFKHIIEPRKFIEVVANVSAYTAAPDENGNEEWSGLGYYTGEPLEEGSIAMDGVPAGTEVEIEVDGVVKTFVVKDRFGHKWSLKEQIENNNVKIDIFVSNKEIAWEFGRQQKPVKIYI